MFPTPYWELNQVLGDLVSRIQLVLGNNFVGTYLQGSFAIGDYDQEILRRHSKRGMELWYLDHGARSLIRSDHCNSILVRWIVREKGISLAGPPPKTLVDPISGELLREEIFETLTDWGQEILDNPAPYANRFYQGYIVLNYCRMLHDLHRGHPSSKQEGAEWAKSVLDPSWSDLIDGAWDGRPDPAKKVQQPADPKDFEKTLKFVEYAMNESRLYFARNNCA